MLFLACIFPLWGSAQQPTFEQVNTEVGMNATYSTIPFYASGLSVRDFDQDGWDDISVCTDIGGPPRFFKNYYGTFKEVQKGFAVPVHGNYIVWVDYDNDGDLDCIGVNNNTGPYIKRTDSLGNLDDVTATVIPGPLPTIEREGGMLADFNNDGLLDFFLSVYEFGAPNSLFFQNANHQFIDVSATSNACDSLDHTFHAIAIDYNNDGWMDFYEANDFYDGNMFYKNNGDSTFTEVSYTNGTYQELDAMGLGVGDFDGDLDLDIHITDRFNHSMLLRNNGDETFTEVAAQHNLDYIDGFGWGNNWFDADLDGDNDIYISGIKIPFLDGLPSHLYINDGQANFTADTLEEDSLFSFANGIFDFNNDRLPDIVSLNSENNPHSVWKNTTATSAKRFTIKLEGCASNKDAIGAQMIAFDGPDKRLWMTHSSQSYCSQNADRQIIPILNGPVLDSLLIKWPIGGDTTLYGIAPDQTIKLVECGSAEPYPVIKVHDYPEHELVLCPDDSITLSVDGNYSSVLWSTGAITDTIVVTSAGVYDVTVTNQYGVSSGSTQPVVVSAFNYPNYESFVKQPLCFNNGYIAVRQAEPASDYIYEWSTGATTDSIYDLTPGNYTLSITNQGECGVTDTFILEGPDSLNPIVLQVQTPPVLCNGDSVAILVSGSGGYGPLTYEWSNGATSSSQALGAGSYVITATDTNECKTDTSFSLTEPDPLFVWAETIPDTNALGKGMAWVEIDGGVDPYQVVWDDSLVQTGDTAYNLRTGSYTASVTDANGCAYERLIEVKNRELIGISASAGKSLEITCVEDQGTVMLKGVNHQNVEVQDIKVYDALGKHVSCGIIDLGNGSFTLNIQNHGLSIIHINGHQACKVVLP